MSEKPAVPAAAAAAPAAAPAPAPATAEEGERTSSIATIVPDLSFDAYSLVRDSALRPLSSFSVGPASLSSLLRERQRRGGGSAAAAGSAQQTHRSATVSECPSLAAHISAVIPWRHEAAGRREQQQPHRVLHIKLYTTVGQQRHGVGVPFPRGAHQRRPPALRRRRDAVSAAAAAARGGGQEGAAAAAAPSPAHRALHHGRPAAPRCRSALPSRPTSAPSSRPAKAPRRGVSSSGGGTRRRAGGSSSIRTT